ncbi:hypothetical protein, partial [Xanthomonas arboricola]|uniref:hypothetical protein n=1 Tax=Xanthomonas arboricola TaxID=56448 RepID=UPI001C613440
MNLQTLVDDTVTPAQRLRLPCRKRQDFSGVKCRSRTSRHRQAAKQAGHLGKPPRQTGRCYGNATQRNAATCIKAARCNSCLPIPDSPNPQSPI